jgi:hypothetical protein
LATWLENESTALDAAITKLHTKQKLDISGYWKNSPDDCPLQRFKYRVQVLAQLAD